VTSDDDEWVGFVSGLEMGSSTPTDAQLQMLTEYLTGEEGGEEDQLGAARISRLIIAGNSVTASALADRIETPSYAERKAVCFFPVHLRLQTSCEICPEKARTGPNDLRNQPYLRTFGAFTRHCSSHAYSHTTRTRRPIWGHYASATIPQSYFW